MGWELSSSQAIIQGNDYSSDRIQDIGLAYAKWQKRVTQSFGHATGSNSSSGDLTHYLSI